MLKWITLSALAIAACAHPPDAIECASGITCPEGTKCGATQAVCITNDCGDGIVQQGKEVCDDGNIRDGDGCAANCLSTEACGDGTINKAKGEDCDDRNTLGGDGCSADCKVESCGNMTRDVGEACDDGNTVSGDGCSGNCLSDETCGNNIKDINEVCDDGGTPGGCNDDCLGGSGCGDGAIDKDVLGNPIEECDDGNGNSNDDCVACKLSKCGDGVVQTLGARIEQCDPSVNFGETAGCNIDCTTASCGDGKINNAAGEQCDDRNLVDADACKNNCKLNYCGDGVPGGPNEACDDGTNTATCNANCTSASCGDFFVNNVNEQCDTGGVATPTCDANCTVAVCGDGTRNPAAGEDCDDMDTDNNDACRNDCRLNVCGDGFVNTGIEACDDGNTANETSCPYGMAICQLCNMNCNNVENLTGNVCGDGTMGGPEACDDGNTFNETACPYGLTSCTLCNDVCTATITPTTVAYCGDGTTQSPMEGCDDHNVNACGTCDAACNMFSSQPATGFIVTGAGSTFQDNDTLTINDGFGTTVTFEFDANNNGVTTGNVKIQTGATDTASTMRTNIRTAINATALLITATDVGGSLVALTHGRNSTRGNVAIIESVNAQDFAVSGMSGGTGGNCAATIGCKTNADCASYVCMNNVCQ